MAKPPTKAERAHMGRVAQMPCLVCQHWPVEVHHVTGYADRIGRAVKQHMRLTPLCAAHHRTGPMSVHNLSHRGFYDAHGIDLMAVAEELANAWV